jgi:hypothetical protein
LNHCGSAEFCFTNFNFLCNGNVSTNTKFDELPADFWPSSTELTEDGALVVNEPLYGAILKYQPIFPSSVMLTRSLFDRVGGFNEKFARNSTEDFEFTLRCAQEHPTAARPEPLFSLRLHDSKLSGNALRNTFAQIAILEHALESHSGAAQYRGLILQRLHGLRLEGAHGLFSSGRYQELRDLIAQLDPADAEMKLRLKILLSHYPRAAAFLMRLIGRRQDI